MNKLATLYKKTSTGAIQTWRIDVEGSTLVKTYGQIDGKLQVARDLISEGKNIGQSNETTPVQQAEIEAQSQWDKKVKKGYVVEIGSAVKGEVDETVITGGINPMLAHPFSKQGHKIVFPAFLQPKLDGHRCIAVISDGKATLWSRTRKPIVSMPHIVAALESTVKGDVILDGELYNHAYRDRFEELTSLIRPAYAKDGHEVVQYHIYDIASVDWPFEGRTAELDLFAEEATYPLVIVETILVNNETDAMDIFEEFLLEGYEGAMLRNAKSPYVNKRSYDLLKIKEFDDAEFKIVDVVEGRGKLAGKGIFVCETSKGDIFQAKLKGNIDDLAKYLANADDYIGQLLTVQFQGYTNSNVPRFAIGLRLRQDV